MSNCASLILISIFFSLASIFCNEFQKLCVWNVLIMLAGRWKCVQLCVWISELFHYGTWNGIRKSILEMSVKCTLVFSQVSFSDGSRSSHWDTDLLEITSPTFWQMVKKPIKSRKKGLWPFLKQLFRSGTGMVVPHNICKEQGQA